MPLVDSFLQYIVVFVILAAVAVGGVFLGKILRSRKDTKTAAEVLKKKEEK